MAPTQVWLFGRVRVACGGRLLDDRSFPSRKAKQVFELLALAGGAAVAKERIVDQIWGDKLPRNPMATLEHTVSILRASCFQDCAGPVIVTVNGGYRLDTRTVSIDLVRFQQLVRAAAVATPPNALQLLSDAVRSADGVLLEDEPNAEWAEVARHDYRRQVERAAVDAARLALLEDDADIALAMADRAQALAVLPSEDAYHLQASALVRLGRRADALVLLHDAEVALERELHSGLPPATVALRESLRTSSPDIRPAEFRLDLGGFNPPRLLAFLGRADEIDRIAQLAADTAAGASRLLVVEGPAGIGKTRLLDEVVSTPGLRATDGRVVRLTCTVPGRSLARFTAARLHRALAGADEPARVLPAGPDAATVLFDRLAASIDAAGPTVVLLDDVHLADDESLAIIGALAGVGGVAGLGVVATRRRPPRGSDDPLRGAERIVLGPLDEVALAPAGGAAALGATGGNPLVLDAAAEAARNGGHLWDDTVDALLARIDEPGPLAREVLVVVTALGRPSTTAELAYVLGLVPEVVHDLLDRLVCLGLAVVVAGTVDVADDVSRQVLRTAVGPERARAIRAVAGQARGSVLHASADAG